MKEKIYFISDVHLGMPNPKRSPRKQEDALIGFLRSIRDEAAVLYIVGDLFDFWFEYRSAVPSQSARIVFELYQLVQCGVRVVYVPGNHDLWPGRYFSEQVGVDLPGDPVDVAHQGRRLYLTHGDSFRGDWQFRLSRYLLRHPICIGLFRLLHPDLGAWLARWTSRWSEYRAKHRPITDDRIFLCAAKAKIAEGFDYVICGHYHRNRVEKIGEGKLVILGDWVQHDSYAVMADGAIEIRRWITEGH